jgi:elongation factor Ts
MPNSTITPKQVMDLRAATGLPMMKCKDALEAEGGDFEKAIDRLRKEGLKTADSKASRATGDGLVKSRVAADGRSGAMVSVLCETEPVSKTAMFVEFVDKILAQVEATKPDELEKKGVAGLLAQPYGGDRSQTVEAALKGMIAKIGENMKIDRAVRLEVDGSGVVATYVHHDKKKGALVAVGSPKPTPQLAEVARQLCMHVVYARPAASVRQDVPADLVERERGVIREQVANDPKMKGKPPQVLEKIVEGKLDAFYKVRVLPEQPWYQDDSKSVTQVLQAAGGTIQRWAMAIVGA